jgi:hypothetical protein
MFFRHICCFVAIETRRLRAQRFLILILPEVGYGLETLRVERDGG